VVVDLGEIDITLKCYNIYKKQKRKKEVKMMPAISSTFQVLSVLSRFFQYFPGSFSTFQVLSVLSRFLEWQGKKFWSKDKMGWASELGGVKGDQVGPSKAKPMPEPCSR
jgi:hypothetical protein